MKSQTVQTRLSPEVAKELQGSIRGPVFAAGDDQYEETRRIWNAAVDKRPALIARCTGTADVMAALAFARRHDLQLAIRGGGHNVAGTALCDDGLLIDLQLMRGIRVDPVSQTVLAQPGLRLRDVDHETEAFGLALVSGINGETGLAGLALGGGIGWQMRRHGLTIDHLRSADVVTADGRLVKASAEENSELFWALRGGGGNFGIVTAFDFDLVRFGPPVYGGTVLYPASEAAIVLRRYRDWALNASDEVTTIVVLRRNAFPWSPPETHGQPVIGVGALYAGPAPKGEAALAALHSLGTVLASSVRVKPFTEHQTMWDASAPAGRHYYWKSQYLRAMPDAVLDVVVERAWQFTSPYSFTLLSHMGGAITRVPDEATAFTGRDAEFTVNMNCAATDPAAYEADREWVRAFFGALEPHTTGGVYVNFLGDEGADRVRAAYGEKYGRLAALKAALDPDNVFRVNQNIPPAAFTRAGEST